MRTQDGLIHFVMYWAATNLFPRKISSEWFNCKFFTNAHSTRNLSNAIWNVFNDSHEESAMFLENFPNFSFKLSILRRFFSEFEQNCVFPEIEQIPDVFSEFEQIPDFVRNSSSLFQGLNNPNFAKEKKGWKNKSRINEKCDLKQVVAHWFIGLFAESLFLLKHFLRFFVSSQQLAYK